MQLRKLRWRGPGDEVKFPHCCDSYLLSHLPLFILGPLLSWLLVTLKLVALSFVCSVATAALAVYLEVNCTMGSVLQVSWSPTKGKNDHTHRKIIL